MSMQKILLGVALLGTTAQAATLSLEACGTSVDWDLADAVVDESSARYREAVLGRLPAIRSFAEAMALRRSVREEEGKVFSEFWASWSLWKLGLHHSAYQTLGVVAARPLTPKTKGPQEAALHCLAEIQLRYPTFDFPQRVSDRLIEYPVGEARSKAALASLKQLVGAGRAPEAETGRLVALTQEGTPYRLFSRALAAASALKHEDTWVASEQYFASGGVSALRPFEDALHVLAGRAYYSKGKYSEASTQFQQVQKNSNHLSRSLSDLAWTWLRDEKYKEALGTVISLHSGSFRRTFAPEAPMVMAMAFNEICHYPDSLKAVEAFRQNYKSSFDWLRAWNADPTKADVYRKAVSFLRKPKESEVPERVASEWVRSPAFIGRQDEINLLMNTKTRVVTLSEEGRALQAKMAFDLLELVKSLKPRFESAKAQDPEGELPLRVRQDIDKLREMATAYRNMKRAAPAWRLVLDSQQKRAGVSEKRLVASIRHDLTQLNRRMLAQLEDVADNIYFVEVEIFQGATQDIIWQNAHPEFRKLAQELSREEKRDQAKVWDWGKITGGLAGVQEIWEDELGSFRADLPDNCESKERYLNIRRTAQTNGM